MFWILSLFFPSEKVEKKDYLKILAAAFLGYFVTQLTFLVAIPDVTPMHCSIISSMSPIYTMFIAAIVLKEPLSWKKTAGVALSLCGIYTDKVIATVIFIAASTPAAAATSMFAEMFDGDTKLSGVLVPLSTILSLGTMPLTALLLKLY